MPSKLFEKLRTDYIDDDEFRRLQNFLLLNPYAGEVIQGTSGLRKLRWSLNNKGKRGGIRTIYLYLDKKDHIHLITLYEKNETTDLTNEQKKILKGIVEEIKNG